jgi:hypothetical protein
MYRLAEFRKRLIEISTMNGGFVRALNQGAANAHVLNHDVKHESYTPPSEWKRWIIKPS